MKKDGGPAFPSAYELPENQGLTVRDYFAAKAMQGAMTQANNLGRLPDADRAEALLKVSVICYEVADAMLKAREQ